MFATNTGRNSESMPENEEREAGMGGFNQEEKPFEQKLEQLMQTLSRMKIFIKKINELQIKIENNIIYNFCDLYQKPPLSSDVIVPLLDKRIERMMKNRRLKKNWSQEDLQILVWTVNHFASLNNIDKIQKITDFHWKTIASLIPGTTGQSCMFKILSLRKVRLSEENWSQTQSNLLFQIVRDFQFVDWKIASQELFKRNRSQSKIFRNAKQCKQHWNCYLNPNLKKGPWSVQQDIILIQYIIENSGRKKWTQISKIFSGRTQNALKNRYNLLVERYRLGGEVLKQRYELKMLENILDDLLEKRMRCREYVDNNKTKDEFRSKDVSNTPNSPHTTHSFDVDTKSGLVKSPKKIQLKPQSLPEMIKQQTIIVNNGTPQKPEIKSALTIEAPESNVANQSVNVNLNAHVGMVPEAGQEWSGDAMYPVFYNGYGFWVFFNQNYP